MMRFPVNRNFIFLISCTEDMLDYCLLGAKLAPCAKPKQSVPCFLFTFRKANSELLHLSSRVSFFSLYSCIRNLLVCKK